MGGPFVPVDHEAILERRADPETIMDSEDRRLVKTSDGPFGLEPTYRLPAGRAKDLAEALEAEHDVFVAFERDAARSGLTIETMDPADVLANYDSWLEHARTTSAMTVASNEPSSSMIERVIWTWAARIPRSGLSLLAGMPGVGKSTIAYDLAASLTRGTLPGEYENRPQKVYILSAEDTQGVISARLAAAGADFTKVRLISKSDPGQPLALPDDLQELNRVMMFERPALVIIDPIAAFLSERTNAHREADVRRVLAEVTKIAEERRTAVLGIMHYRKASEGDILHRLSGSIGFGGAARSVMVVAPEDGADTSLLVHIKTNWGQEAPTLRYAIETTLVTDRDGAEFESSKIRWRGEEASVTRSDIGDTGRVTAHSRAKQFVVRQLSDGPMPSRELEEAAKEEGISRNTLHRARKSLAVAATQIPGGWMCSAPNPPSAEWESVAASIGQDGATDGDNA